MTKSDNYTDLLLKDIRSQVTTILEIVSNNQQKIDIIPIIESDVKDLKADMLTIKTAVAETNKDLHLLERGVTKLEEAR